MAVLFSGCTTVTSTQRLYSGEPLPKERVAVIMTETTTAAGSITRKYTLLKVDNDSISYYKDNRVEILPGFHTLEIQLEKTIAPRNNTSVSLELFGNKKYLVEPEKSLVITVSGKLFTELEPGKTYSITGNDDFAVKKVAYYGTTLEKVVGSGEIRLTELEK